MPVAVIAVLIVGFFVISVNFLFSKMPQVADGINMGWLGALNDMISTGLLIFPVDVWVVLTANVLLWLGIQFAWACIEWIYRKIPGVE